MNPADPGRGTSASTGGATFEAANDDHGPASPAHEMQQREAGWDPFEVWCTRVRDPRRDWIGLPG